jgi:hypothetical protein
MSTESPTSPDLFLLDGPEDFLNFSLKLLSNTKRNIAILSTDLDPLIYNSDAVIEAISLVARSSRNAEINILVRETKLIAESGHKLARLAQRLPSKMNIRKIVVEPEDKKMAFMLCDTKSLIYKNDEEYCRGFANFSAAAEVNNLQEIFDYLWQYAETDPELQQFLI